ncbi:MAG: hypothetical protein GY820_12415 [Gammaproteobacteria bacterium]|nr:hypothetical protein [Gammaproteobacteria bacterium]
MKSTILLLLTVFSLFSCAQEKKIKNKTWIESTDFGEKIIAKNAYDIEGKLVLEEFWDADSSSLESTYVVKKYNSLGKLGTSRTEINDGQMIVNYFQDYDSLGLAIRSISSIYERSNNTSDSTENIFVNTLNQKGLVERMIVKNSFGDSLGRLEFNYVQGDTILLSEKVFSLDKSKEGLVVSETYYMYNDGNKLISKEINNLILEETTRTEYKYNSAGYLIEQIEYQNSEKISKSNLSYEDGLCVSSTFYNYQDGSMHEINITYDYW